MSAYASIVAPDGAFLLTDAAVRSSVDHTVIRFQRKVWTPAVAAVAVTSLGNYKIGQEIAAHICAAADKIGAEKLMATMQDLIEPMKTLYRGDGYLSTQVMVTAFIPGKGGVHCRFYNIPSFHYEGDDLVHLSPFKVHYLPEVATHGLDLEIKHWRRDHIRRRAGEPYGQWWHRIGPDLMEFGRRPTKEFIDGTEICVVGGWCDFTTIDAAGTRTETLRVWPDEVGKPIDPFFLPDNAAPSTISGRSQ